MLNVGCNTGARQRKDKMKHNLPKFTAVFDKPAIDRTALERFIFEHEPMKSHGGDEWRSDLCAAMQEEAGGEWVP